MYQDLPTTKLSTKSTSSPGFLSRSVFRIRNFKDNENLIMKNCLKYL